MAFEEGIWGGLAGLVANEKIPFSLAIEANDCYVDDDTIRPRNGYRKVLTNPVPGGSYTVSYTKRFVLVSAQTATVTADGASSPYEFTYSIAVPTGFTCTAYYLDIAYSFPAVSTFGTNLTFYSGTAGSSDGFDNFSSKTTTGSWTQSVTGGSNGIKSAFTAAAGTNKTVGISINGTFVSGVAQCYITSLVVTLVGTISGTIPDDVTPSIQGVGRFRPSFSSARTIVIADGDIYGVVDPTSNTLSDGSASTIHADAFGTAENIAHAQHGSNYYLCSDEVDSSWWRIKSDYSAEELISLPKPTVPTATTASQSFVKFSSLSTPTTAGSANYTLSYTDYYKIHGATASDRCPDGGSIYWNLGANKDWSGIDWLAVVCASPTVSRGGYGGTVNIYLAKQTAGAPDDFILVGTINDRYDSNPGSPNLVYVNLNDLPSATRSAVRYIKFQLSGADDQFAPHGYLPIPSAPGYGPQKYRVTFKNSTTGLESDPSDEVEVVFKYADVTIPNYHNVYGNGSSFTDSGQRAIDPDKTNEGREYNVAAGLSKPLRADMSTVASFAGSIPVNCQYPNTDSIRLWRLTETGWRLVKSTSFSSGTTYSAILDDQGSKVLTNELWRPNGTLPRLNTLASWGGRLVGGYENRVYISDFIPVSQDANPYPRFAKIAVEDADGWAFDIASSNAEPIQTIVAGDVPYIISNKQCWFMPSLAPDTPPVLITSKGGVGRKSAIYVENTLIWASHDGVYTCGDRVTPEELTKNIRRIYTDWLVPNGECLLAYQNRKLLVIQKTKFLRYDFVTGRWTRGTLSHDTRFACVFVDPPTSALTGEQLWLLHLTAHLSRWQPDCDEDLKLNDTDYTGTAIPSWVYETGYQVEAYRQTLDHLYIDCSGDVRVRMFLDESEDEYREENFTAGESVSPFSADFTNYKFKVELTGGNTCQLKRAMFERGGLDLENAA